MVAGPGRTGYRRAGALGDRRYLTFLFGLVGLLLLCLNACQETAEPTLAAAAPPLTREETRQPGKALPSRTLVPSWTPSPSPTASPAPSATALPTLTPTEEPTVRHLRIFDQLYDLVLENYLYPDYNGLNWPVWGAVYRERVAAGMSDDEFHQAMSALISMLDDGHSVFQSPAAADVTNAIVGGRHQSVGIGVQIASRPESDTAVLLDVFPDGPAWKAGLRSHDSLIALDGYPILGQLANLNGAAGSVAKLTVASPGEAARQVAVRRASVASPPPVTAFRWEESEIVVVLIRTFWDRNVVSMLRHHLRQLGDEKPIGGVVIDMRINHGGTEYCLEGTLSFFADGTLGAFARRQGERPLEISPVPVHNSQHVPLVILIGRETSSYAEIFAGVLQSTGRARLVGTPTQGNVETIWPHSFEDGSRLWIAEEGFRSLNNGDWEDKGIKPDYYVSGDWADFSVDNDLQLETALRLLSPD